MLDNQWKGRIGIMDSITNMDEQPHWVFPDELYASSRTRGLYSPSRLLVRLRRDFNELLSSDQLSVPMAHADPEMLSAFSTYFHETIHWWQHIGSTTGLMLSFAYPAHCHVNRAHLLDVLAAVGPQKSLRRFLEAEYHTIPEETRRQLNIILNNWHDVEFNRRIILNPLKIREVAESPFFESVGHSLEIGLGQTLWMLSATFDPNFEFMPDIRKWEEGFADLKRRKVKGFYYGSPISLVPVGALQIFEGQARFNQIQYLYLASGGNLTWSDFEKMGMMSDTYVGAFRHFLDCAELTWPATPVDPVVQLFLLVCDLAINPSDGYPFDLHHFESFIVSADPGFRFHLFSRHLAKNPALKSAISNCNASEYIELSTILCKSLVCHHPVEIAEHIMKWVAEQESLKGLLIEDDTFHFQNVNLPVRLCFAKHIRFASDRISRPEFFCWPAMHFVENPVTTPDLDESLALWQRHQPLFLADLEGEIHPVLHQGRDESGIEKTFNNFYSWNIVYDLVSQWIVSEGPFDLDYTWLTPNYTTEVVGPLASEKFRESFGVGLDEFNIR